MGREPWAHVPLSPFGPAPTNKTTARDAPRNQKRKYREGTARRVPGTDFSWAALSCSETKRLSATDISALASMKNVAKCDTWCELQNPVNHRVFERKLRPKPSGRGHVCLGVMHRRPPILPTPPEGEGGTGRAETGLPCAPARGWPKYELLAAENATASGGCQRPSEIAAGEAVPRLRDPVFYPQRPQVRRDHPLSLSISISGGKETYQDSPSNGERTGKSPA